MPSNGSFLAKTLGLAAGLEQVQVQDQMIQSNRLNGFCHQEELDKKLLKNEIIIMTIVGTIMPDNKLYLPEYKGSFGLGWSVKWFGASDTVAAMSRLPESHKL